MDGQPIDEPSAPAPAGTAAAPDNAVTVRGLSKVYRAQGKSPENLALKGVDLDIPRGALFGLLGPNGAGKSTLINILAGLANKTDGAAAIWGYDLDRDPRAPARRSGSSRRSSTSTRSSRRASCSTYRPGSTACRSASA